MFGLCRCTTPESEPTRWRSDPSVSARQSSAGSWPDQPVRSASHLIRWVFVFHIIDRVVHRCCVFFFYPGKCFRLYPEDERLPAENRPLILESNITPTVLFLKRLEIAGLAQCDFMDRPGESWDREGGAILGCIPIPILFT